MSALTVNQLPNNGENVHKVKTTRLLKFFVATLLLTCIVGYISIAALKNYVDYAEAVPLPILVSDSQRISRSPDENNNLYWAAAGRYWYEETYHADFSSTEIKAFYEAHNFQCIESEIQLISSSNQPAWVCTGDLRFNADMRVTIPQSQPDTINTYYIQVSWYPIF